MRIILLCFFSAQLFSCAHIPRTVWNNFPSVRDTEPEIYIPKPDQAWYFETEMREIPPAITWVWQKKQLHNEAGETFLKKSGTSAFLMVKSDSIIMEYYGKNTFRNTRFNTHSVSKVLVSSLVAIAWSEAYIRSLDQPLTDYLPELSAQVSSDLRIVDLLQMTSGLNFSENYLNLFSSINRMYFGTDTQKELKRIRQKHTPGNRFEYRSGNTWLLCRVLERATGMSIAEYTQTRLWIPLGVPADAGWIRDKKSMQVKGFTGFNTSAIGLARIGQLYANKGMWKGQVLIPETWMNSLLKPDTLRASPIFYQKGWFFDDYYQDITAEGLFYQHLYVHPDSRTVIVRIGDGVNGKPQWRSAFRSLAGVNPKPLALPFYPEAYKVLQGMYVFGESQTGDSSLFGRKVKVKVKPAGLKIITLKNNIIKDHKSFNKNIPKPLLLLPEADYVFFDPVSGRRMVFDESGNHFTWKRKDNIWELKRINKKDTKDI